jgi:hypothetical protein
MKKQTGAILLCKQKVDFKAMTAKERNAVTKTLMDDTCAVANWFMQRMIQSAPNILMVKNE